MQWLPGRAGTSARVLWPFLDLTIIPVLAENAHPFDREPIEISNSFGLLPEREEPEPVSADKAVPW